MGKNKVEETYWKVFPPYIDAYKTNPYDYDNFKCLPTSHKDFKNAMIDLAFDWNRSTIGEQYLRDSGVLEFINGQVCVVVGWYNDEKYGLFVRKNWDYSRKDIHIRKFDYPKEWDVT